MKAGFPLPGNANIAAFSRIKKRALAWIVLNTFQVFFPVNTIQANKVTVIQNDIMGSPPVRIRAGPDSLDRKSTL